MKYLKNIKWLFFEHNNTESLEQKIQNWFINFHNNRSRNELRSLIIKNYNPKFQIKIFEESLNNI